MEIRRTRINYKLLGKLRSVKQNIVFDKTLYAKKLGLIKNDANLIVVDVANTSIEAQEKINKLAIDFGYDRANEKHIQIISQLFSYVYDRIKSQHLVVCDKSEYIMKMKMKNKTKFIVEYDFLESDYIDENYLPYRVNWEHLGKVEEERNRLLRGAEYILVHNIEQKQKLNEKKLINKVFDTIYNFMSGGIFGSIEV
jgi:hypothetical protein